MGLVFPILRGGEYCVSGDGMYLWVFWVCGIRLNERFEGTLLHRRRKLDGKMGGNLSDVIYRFWIDGLIESWACRRDKSLELEIISAVSIEYPRTSRGSPTLSCAECVHACTGTELGGFLGIIWNSMPSSLILVSH